MRLLYDIFFLIFGIFYVPYSLVKGKARAGFWEKAGFLPKKVSSLKKPIWIHAVSVGEAALAVKFCREIKNIFPDIPVIISATTKTGMEILNKQAPGIASAIFYYPFDLSLVVRNVVKKVDPLFYVMIETELWPNLLEEMRFRKVPVILANGRISDSSFASYRRIKPVIKRVLSCVDVFCVQTADDALKIKELGAPCEKVFVTGSMKFDGESESAGGSFDKVSLGFSESDSIFVAGSTHSPEEEITVGVFKNLKEKYPNLKLILAPRHVERADEVAALIEKNGFKHYRLSQMLGVNGFPKHHIPHTTYHVLLIDTIGHLKNIYAVGDVIFIGGSMAKRGGQNPIEAARWGKAVLFGPNMTNFREVAEIFVKNNAALQVKDAEELRAKVDALLSDPGKVRELVERAREVIEKNQGATKRTIERITYTIGNQKSKCKMQN